MKKALVVGIDHYPSAPLSGCVNDAKNISELISRNEDGSPNFDCKLLTSDVSEIKRPNLREAITKLFDGDGDMALLYFAGHGTSNNLGGYLVTQDATKYDEGVSMAEILALANKSRIKECIIMLDCCHSGYVGTTPEIDNKAVIKEGLSILTACRSDQLSGEVNGSGLFTSLVCDALRGSASDLLGTITTASVYAHVEPIFTAWEQRPLFKTHISKTTALRKCKPLLDPNILRELTTFFHSSTTPHKLDSTYEPDAEPKNHPNEKIFAKLQRCTQKGLVKPDGEDHMYYAAMNNKSCSLTPLGQFYWHLAKAGKI